MLIAAMHGFNLLFLVGGIIVGVVGAILFVTGMEDGQLKGFVWGLVLVVVGVVSFFGSIMSESDANAEDQAAHEKGILAQLKHDGFPANNLYEDGYGQLHVVLQYKGCTWNYELDKRGSKYTLVRGSGAITNSPPVKPEEVGHDSPEAACALPM